MEGLDTSKLWYVWRMSNGYCELLYYLKFFFLVGCVEERLWWPIQRPNRGRKKKANSEEEREIRSGLLILDLKDGSCIIDMLLVNSRVAAHLNEGISRLSRDSERTYKQVKK